MKAQTRVWDYDLQNAGDHGQNATGLTNNPAWVDPNKEGPTYSVDETTYPPEDIVVERLQDAGLMARPTARSTGS